MNHKFTPSNIMQSKNCKVAHCKAYNLKNIVFGKEYIIPKPTDPRLISIVAPAVAKAAMESGVAQSEIKDWEIDKEEFNQIFKKSAVKRTKHEGLMRNVESVKN